MVCIATISSILVSDAINVLKKLMNNATQPGKI